MSINETRLHAMQLTYTIDGYDRCRQRKLPLMPSHERKLYHPDNFNKDLHRDTSYGNDGGWNMGSVRKSRYGDGITFRCFLVSLFSSSLLWISARYKWRRHGLLPPPDHSQVELGFPRTPVPPKGCHCAVPIGCGTYGFVRLCT